MPILSFLYIFIFTLLTYKHANAIIVAPAVLIIPLINILGFIMGLLGLPVITASVVFAKLKHTSPIKYLIFGLGISLIILMCVAIFILLKFPNTPIF